MQHWATHERCDESVFFVWNLRVRLARTAVHDDIK